MLLLLFVHFVFKERLFKNDTLTIFPRLLQNIDHEPPKNWPMITSTDLHVRIDFLIDIQFLKLVVFPKHDPITVTGIAILFQSVLSCVFVQLVSGNEMNGTLSVQFEIINWRLLIII